MDLIPISVSWTSFGRCLYTTYSWVATSENRSKIGDFAPARSVWSKISGKSRPHQSILHW